MADADRSSNKHNPRLDDQLEHEAGSVVRGEPVDSRARDDKRTDSSDDEEPAERSRAARPLDPVEGMRPDDVEARSDLARLLDGSIFPAPPDRIEKSARENHAPEELASALARLPDREYVNVEDVWEALGGPSEAGEHTG